MFVKRSLGLCITVLRTLAERCGDLYGWGCDGGKREKWEGDWCLRVGDRQASKLLVKWKWLFSRIQDTCALRWINVADLLSESLSEGTSEGEKLGLGGMKSPLMEGEKGGWRGKLSVRVTARVGPNQRDCSSAPYNPRYKINLSGRWGRAILFCSGNWCGHLG